MSQVENAQALKNGALVAFPTETVYGLGADASNEKAVGIGEMDKEKALLLVKTDKDFR